MSRKADCYANALMESFIGTLKTECVERESSQTREEAQHSIFEYLEVFYVRSVQPKLTITSKGMAGKDMNLDNS
jgi:transposase InsO family protein